MAAATNPSSAAAAVSSVVSPFEDPTTPSLVLPKSTSTNSDTNPFRVRNASGSIKPTSLILSVFPQSPTKMSAQAPPPSPGPKSKNPFLDLPGEDSPAPEKTPSTSTSPEIKVSKDPKEASQRNPTAIANGNSRPHPRPSRRPDDPNSLRPSSSHRRRDPSKLSDRDRDRDRYRERRDRPAVDPSRRPRPRSNSESSVPSERAQRRKDDGHIHKSKSRREKDDKKDDKKPTTTTKDGKRRLHPVDKIDLLDVTGLYGSHGFFHHDGPFDACRPHRNKQPHKAPVAAFPADSLTNTLAGGLGEVPGLDRDKYFGLTPQEAFQDYGVAAAAPTRRTSDPERPILRPVREETDNGKLRPTVGIRSTSFDPRLKTEPVHGVESAGLGTSTFLEGAPAPKSAIERAGLEEEEGGGLMRKKSLVQKIKARRATGDRSPPPPSGPLLSPSHTNVDSAYNPFFKEGQFVERVDSLPNPVRERANSGGSDKVGTGGLLGRVKSLKISGGRRTKKVEEAS